jgi:hypothetical protein
MLRFRIELPEQPRPRHPPVARDSNGRHVQYVCSLFYAQSRKEPQLDYLHFARIDRRKRMEKESTREVL